MSQRTVAIVLFDGFELLDVFGPVELLSMLPDEFRLTYLGPTAGPVASSQGVTVNADTSYDDAQPANIVMVPGGMGTRPLVEDDAFISWLRAYAESSEIVSSVCTGSAVLAVAGLLEGYAATSNKKAFKWVRELGDNVEWRAHARWVHDRNRWTSSGVAAGMDMTAALIGELYGPEKSRAAADFIELEVQTDPSHDRFADIYGL